MKTNTLENIRIERRMTYENLGIAVGYNRSAVWTHCRAEKIPAEAAIRYSHVLGIPLDVLRPDLAGPAVSSRNG